MHGCYAIHVNDAMLQCLNTIVLTMPTICHMLNMCETLEQPLIGGCQICYSCQVWADQGQFVDRQLSHVCHISSIMVIFSTLDVRF